MILSRQISTVEGSSDRSPSCPPPPLPSPLLSLSHTFNVLSGQTDERRQNHFIRFKTSRPIETLTPDFLHEALAPFNSGGYQNRS